MSVTRIPYTEEQRRRDQEHLKDVQYYNDNYQELLSRYPEQWIGIMGQQVVGAAASEGELIAQLKAGRFAWDSVFRSRLTEKEDFLIATCWGEDELQGILNVQRVLH